jgi:hypothetical protein
MGNVKFIRWTQYPPLDEGTDVREMPDYRDAVAYYERGIKAYDQISEIVPMTGRQQRMRDAIVKMRIELQNAAKSLNESGFDEIQ